MKQNRSKGQGITGVLCYKQRSGRASQKRWLLSRNLKESRVYPVNSCKESIPDRRNCRGPEAELGRRDRTLTFPFRERSLKTSSMSRAHLWKTLRTLISQGYHEIGMTKSLCVCVRERDIQDAQTAFAEWGKVGLIWGFPGSLINKYPLWVWAPTLQGLLA